MPDIQDFKKAIFAKLRYRPHEGQAAAHKCDAKVIACFGAERGGKSRCVSVEGTLDAMAGWPVAVAGQDYDACRPEMEYILADLQQLEQIKRQSVPRQGKWVIETIHDGVVESVSLKDGAVELTATGKAYYRVILVEAGRLMEDAMTSALGRVAEFNGKVMLSGTLWDNWGWYADLYRMLKGPNPYNGVGFSFPAWMNLAIYPGGRDDPRIKFLEKTYTEDEFARRVCALLIPSPAQMYPEFEVEPGLHLRDVPFNPEEPVELTADAGYSPAKYAVLAGQRATNEHGMEVVNWIDEIWVNLQYHEHVIAMAKEKPWWKNVIKIWGGHESRQHPAAKSMQETWEELALTPSGERIPFIVVDAGRIRAGIPTVRRFLKDTSTGVPRMFFDQTRCTGSAYEFRNYKRRTNRKGEVTSNDPEDKNNDIMDALRNFLVGSYGYVDRIAQPWQPPAPRMGGSIG